MKEVIKMKILAVGDLIGNVGVNELKNRLKQIREKEQIDFVIVNGENSAEGMGMTERWKHFKGWRFQGKKMQNRSIMKKRGRKQ